MVVHNVLEATFFNENEQQRNTFLASSALLKQAHAKERRSNLENRKREHGLQKLQKWEEFRGRRDIQIKKYCIVKRRVLQGVFMKKLYLVHIVFRKQRAIFENSFAEHKRILRRNFALIIMVCKFRRLFRKMRPTIEERDQVRM